jgi:predicted phage baseplate assembly protein
MIVPVQASAVSVVGGQQIVAGQAIGVSGKRVRLQVLASANATFTPANSTAPMNVADNQVFLVDAFPPVQPPGGATPLWSVLTTSNIAGSLAVSNNHVRLLPADKKDPVASEAAVVSTVEVAGDVTTLGLRSALARIYDATTVTINANAVEATNGETVHEILGSGNASNDALQFTLKQTPLTYVNAATGNGTQSTLQVWVNNLQWHEVPNLLSTGPADRVFVTRVNAAGNAVVQFGNGVQGARPPTGQSNIRAVYRKGIGSAGMVRAGQLSQPLDRPQGLKAAANPSAASGASDPASAAAIKASAALPTLTLGRVVSLEDYQNFALAFAGVSKALATWTWFGHVRGVFLTIVGTNGATLQADDPVVGNLIQAIRASGDPYVPLQVASFVPLLFQFSAQVRVDQANYDATQVLAQVWQNLNAAFAFDARGLAQSVVAGDIVEVIQQTPGVVAMQLQTLNLSGEMPGAAPAILCAAGPAPPHGAQMLLLDPATQGAIGVWA